MDNLDRYLQEVLQKEKAMNTGINLLGSGISMPINAECAVVNGIENLRQEIARLNPHNVDIGRMNHLLDLQKHIRGEIRMNESGISGTAPCELSRSDLQTTLYEVTEELKLLQSVFMDGLKSVANI